MTKDEAGKIVAVLFASFPSATLERKHVDAYMSALIDLDAKVAGEAVDRLRRTATFLPSISEVRKTAADIQLGPQRSGEQAYAIVLEAVRRHGWPEAPRFRDPNITRAIGVWGAWADLCASPADDPGGRARFIELYEQGANRERSDIVAGKALPPPRANRREFWPRPSSLPPASPAAGSAEVVAIERSQWSNQHRRYSADELEAEMGKRG